MNAANPFAEKMSDFCDEFIYYPLTFFAIYCKLYYVMQQICMSEV